MSVGAQPSQCGRTLRPVAGLAARVCG